MAALGRAVQRGHRVPRVLGGAAVRCVARLRPPVRVDGEVDVRLLRRRNARQGAGVVAMRALVVLVAVLALTGSAGAEAPPTVTPDVLTVGVSLPSEGFEVGVVKGTQVVYAQGFDIDLARALAERLGLS